MESPVRKYLKSKDYQRHKLFRKISRRRKVERERAINEPAEELKKMLKNTAHRQKRYRQPVRYKSGKDEDTRSDTTRRGYHEGDIPWGAGNDAAGQGPMWLLENVGAGMDRPGLITGNAPMVGISANTLNLQRAARPYLDNASKKATALTKEFRARFGDLFDGNLVTNQQINAVMYGRRQAASRELGKYGAYDSSTNRLNVMDKGRVKTMSSIDYDNGHYITDYMEGMPGTHGNVKDLLSALYDLGVQRRVPTITGEEWVATIPHQHAAKSLGYKKIGDYGRHENYTLVGENAKKAIVHTPEQAEKAHQMGYHFIHENAPVYQVTKNASGITTKDINLVDPRVIDSTGKIPFDLNVHDMYRVMLPAAIGGGLWASKEYKNGKDLPRYRIGNNPTNATMNSDGTFVDDNTRIFDDVVITPNGLTTKYGSYTDKNWDRYKAFLNWTKYHDQSTGKLKGEPGLEITSPEFLLLLGTRALQLLQKPFEKLDFGDPYVKNLTFLKVPNTHKYDVSNNRLYGVRPNYRQPQLNLLSVQLQDEMLGEYIGRGAERLVFEDRRNPSRVIKIGNGLNADQKITDFDQLNEAVDFALEMNKLPGTSPLSYEGFIEEGGLFIPWFSQQRVIPSTKIADPFQTFTRQYVLPNGRTPSGKLSAIRRLNIDKLLKRLGYEKEASRPWSYRLRLYPHSITDLGQKNVGFDELGNLRIFDPMIEL